MFLPEEWINMHDVKLLNRHILTARMSAGIVFHFETVEGKKEYLYKDRSLKHIP